MKGTPNKTTLWRSALVAELAKNPKVEPLDLFLRLMRTPQLPLALRVEMARQALPYCHSKPRPEQRTLGENSASGPRVKVRPKNAAGLEDDVELNGNWLRIGAADSAVDLAAFMEAAAQAAGLPAADDADDDVPEAAAATEAADAPEDAVAAKMNKVGPMAFLHAVMCHPDTPLYLRVQVASILAPYLHAKPVAGEQAFEIEDQYGFVVDRALAKRIRDLTLALKLGLPHPVSAGTRSRAEANERLGEKLAAEKQLLSCPDGYRYQDREKDHRRLYEFLQKRKARTKLTQQEDAEEIHLTARVLSYENGADHAEREALRKRDDAEREKLCKQRDKLYDKWLEYEITEREQEEFDRLRAVLRDIGGVGFAHIDPVGWHFHRQLCTEARFHNLPKPTPEEAGKRLKAEASSADIVRKPVPPQGPDEVDFAAWLRGEVSYQPRHLREAAMQRYGGEYLNIPTVPDLVIALVHDEKVVLERELSLYFSWILRLYDKATRDGKTLLKPIRRPRLAGRA